MMRTAVIDIGSNSVKLIIGERSEDRVVVLESLKNVIPIANDTFLKDRITQETIVQTAGILEKYKNVIRDYEIPAPKVIATTAVREARNKDIFIDTIFRKTGLVIEVLNVGDIVYYIDVYLAHKLGAMYPIHQKNLLIAEMGSGSLDVSLMERGLTILNLGLPLGMLRLKQIMTGLDGSLDEVYEAITDHIGNEFAYLERSMPVFKADDVFLVDENYSSYLQNIMPVRRGEANFLRINFDESRTLLSLLADKTPDEIARSFKIPLAPANTIIAYTIILNMFFTMTQNTEICILELSLSEAVLAHALLELELSRKYNKANQLISIAGAIGRKYNVDLTHARCVADLSEKLFDSLRDHLGLKKDTLLYLVMAAYLHDIGMFIHNRGHHRHSEYLINSLNISRLTEEEIKMIACVARYHRKGFPADSHLLYHSLPLDKRIIVQKLCALLRIANALDRSHKQKVKKLEVRIRQNQDVVLHAAVEGNFLLEQQDFLAKKTFFEDITGNKINLSAR